MRVVGRSQVEFVRYTDPVHLVFKCDATHADAYADDRSLNTLLHQVARYKAFNVLVAVVSCKSVNVSAFVNAFFVSENHNGQSAYALVKGDLPSNVKASIVSWCQEEQAGVIKALLRGFIPAEVRDPLNSI